MLTFTKGVATICWNMGHEFSSSHQAFTDLRY